MIVLSGPRSAFAKGPDERGRRTVVRLEQRLVSLGSPLIALSGPQSAFEEQEIFPYRFSSKGGGQR